MKLTLNIGDTKSFVIPLKWGNKPFVPGAFWGLIFTVKASVNDLDANRLFQKVFPGLGIEVHDSRATVNVIHADTRRAEDYPELGNPAFEATAGEYVWDIQANELDEPFRVRTVASGVLDLNLDVTRENEPTGPIYTTEDPVLSMGFPILYGTEPPEELRSIWLDETDNTFNFYDTENEVWVMFTGVAGANATIRETRVMVPQSETVHLIPANTDVTFFLTPVQNMTYWYVNVTETPTDGQMVLISNQAAPEIFLGGAFRVNGSAVFGFTVYGGESVAYMYSETAGAWKLL